MIYKALDLTDSLSKSTLVHDPDVRGLHWSDDMSELHLNMTTYTCYVVATDDDETEAAWIGGEYAGVVYLQRRQAVETAKGFAAHCEAHNLIDVLFASYLTDTPLLIIVGKHQALLGIPTFDDETEMPVM